MYQEKEKYNSEIKNIKQTFINVLDEYKDAYVLSKMNPEDENYNAMYQVKKDELEKILLKMKTLQSSIDTDIQNMTNNIYELEKKTISEKDKINKINEKVGDLNDSKMGSHTFASDLNVLTKNQRIENKGLVIGISLLGLFILFFHKL
jgi:hypothetical protein